MRCPNRTSRQTPAASPWLSQLVLSLPNQNLQGSGVASRVGRGRLKEVRTDLAKENLRAWGKGEEGKVGADGRLNRTMAKYKAEPGIQLAKAGHRQRGAA